MEDIDLVVAPEDGEAALGLVEERGWRCFSGRQRMRFRLDAPALVDVHVWSPDGAGLGFLSLGEFFDDAVPTAVAGVEARALPARLGVQLRLVQNVLRQHLFIGFPLLDFYEMARMIEGSGEELDWRRIRSVGLMHNAARVFYAVLLRLREEFGAAVPDWVIPPAERQPTERVLRRLRRLAVVPDLLYSAAGRSVLMSAAPGGKADKLSRAVEVFLEEPWADAEDDPLLTRALIPFRTTGMQAAFWAWRVLGAAAGRDLSRGGCRPSR